MFKIYDIDYNEVEFPIDKLGYGMKTPGNIGFDIQIGSIIYENIYHQSSYTDKLIKRYPKNRDVNIVLSVVGMDETDLRLKRSEVYAFFRRLGVFYIAEEAQPFKLLKVTIDAGYNIEELNAVWGRAEIPLKVVDTPFKQSLHTTQDIDQEGIQFNDKWAYGMGTLKEEESWRYSFTNENPVFYNAGTEAVKLIQQKESVIELKVNQSAPYVQISDGSIVFSLYKEIKSGDVIRIEGSEVTLSGQNALSDTNYNFLTVKKGWNEWGIRNIDQFEFKIDFRFLYD